MCQIERGARVREKNLHLLLLCMCLLPSKALRLSHRSRGPIVSVRLPSLQSPPASTQSSVPVCALFYPQSGAETGLRFRAWHHSHKQHPHTRIALRKQVPASVSLRQP